MVSLNKYKTIYFGTVDLLFLYLFKQRDAQSQIEYKRFFHQIVYFSNLKKHKSFKPCCEKTLKTKIYISRYFTGKIKWKKSLQKYKNIFFCHISSSMNLSTNLKLKGPELYKIWIEDKSWWRFIRAISRKWN